MFVRQQGLGASHTLQLFPNQTVLHLASAGCQNKIYSRIFWNNVLTSLTLMAHDNRSTCSLISVGLQVHIRKKWACIVFAALQDRGYDLMTRFDDMNLIDITALKQLLRRRRYESYLLLEYPELQDIYDRWARLSTNLITAHHAQGSIRQDWLVQLSPTKLVLPALSITSTILIRPSFPPLIHQSIPYLHELGAMQQTAALHPALS